MKVIGSTLAAAAVGALTATPAGAQGAMIDRQIVNTLNRLMTQYSLLAIRTMVDLTYEHLAIDPRTGDTVITGLTIYPILDWDSEGACTVRMGRITSSGATGFETIESRIEVTGIDIAPSCFEPEPGAMISAFGYDGLTADSVSIDVSYDLPSSAADITLHAAVRDAAVVTLSAAFDYVWLTGLDPEYPEGSLEPVALLREAEVAIENRGLFERLEPMLTAQMGDLGAVPEMVAGMLTQMLSEGGSRSPGAAERAFVESVSAELGRFVDERNRLVLAITPPDGVWLDERVFATSDAAIEALRPTLTSAPLVSRAMVAPDELAAAIAGQVASLGDEAALRVGEALLTGLGAPRSVAHGRALLQPLAEQWNPLAASLVAKAMADEGEAEFAYRMALRAAAGGASGALTTLDAIEETLDATSVLGLQAEALQAWPGAAGRQAADQAMIEGADIGAMRERAHAAALGTDGPRSYASAYYWASLAAAAGDRSSAGLRERLDRRFAGAEGAARDAWKGASQAAAAQAIQTWTNGGLGARIAAAYGLK